MSNGTYHRVLPVADLPAGTKKPVQVDGKCVLLCNAADKFYAISPMCSHQMQPLEKGRMTATYIVCPTHGTRFELATGKHMNPPAFKPIKTYPVQVVDEWIEVLVEDPA